MLELTKKIIYKKVIMLKDNLLTIQNTTQVIFKTQNKPINFYSFNWVELIIGFFYLQMNFLKFIFKKLGDSSNNCSTISQYASILK